MNRSVSVDRKIPQDGAFVAFCHRIRVVFVPIGGFSFNVEMLADLPVEILANPVVPVCVLTRSKNRTA